MSCCVVAISDMHYRFAGVLEEKGVYGLMDGAFARTVWMGLGGFIFWPALEWSNEFFGKIIN